MIFVTVGTHEQQFDRLVKEIDALREKGIIQDKVFVQTGYSNYIPRFCEHNKLISYKEMEEYTKEARIVITHGGPGSIFLPIQYGKVPIVVPRNPDYDEHVDRHQIQFAERMEQNNRILAVYDIEMLEDKIVNYDIYTEKITGNSEDNTKSFTQRLDEICVQLIR